MAPSRGASRPKATKIVAPVKRRARTTSHHHHKYVPFSSRIAKLRIAPLRASHRRDLIPASADLTSSESSYFATALREWLDSNLSTQFTDFAEQVMPYAESLPMILHHEATIFDILMRAIAEASKESFVPLMALLGDLAHDLGNRFETFFERAWEGVAIKAGKSEEVESIEAAFNALGFMGKYMSRVLLADTDVARRWWQDSGRWLGREKARPFVVRFMGEVVGFLLRRAAKEQERLRRIMRWILDDFVRNHAIGPYADGLKVAISEAIKGAKSSVHSDGVNVVGQLEEYATTGNSDGLEAILDVAKGALTSVVHYTDAPGFESVTERLADASTADISNVRSLQVRAELLYIAVTARKGTRISKWGPISEITATLVDTMESLWNPNDLHGDTILRLLASVSSAAPITTMVKNHEVFERLSQGAWTSRFLFFCGAVAELAPDRVATLLRHALQRFLDINWQDSEMELLAILPGLVKSMSSSTSGDLELPQAWQSQIVIAFAGLLESEPVVIWKLRSYLDLLDAMQTRSSDLSKTIACKIWQAISHSLPRQDGAEQQFLLGPALAFATSHSEITGDRTSTLVSLVGQAGSSLEYWQALNNCLEHPKGCKDVAKAQDVDLLSKTALSLLSSRSHELRSESLQSIQKLYRARDSVIPELVEVMTSIEVTSPSIQTARFISSQVRRLGIHYHTCLDDEFLRQAVPTYCFGLLHLRLSQVWDDASEVLKEISRFEVAEPVIIELAKRWLELDENREEQASGEELTLEAGPPRSDFECSNVKQVDAAWFKAKNAFEQAQALLERRLAYQKGPESSADTSCRTQALRILKGNSALAEERSRLLVPVLLQWVGQDDHTGDGDQVSSQSWNRKDRKTMLDIFAGFQNPRVLYKSAAVYDALLKLLTNGDHEIQRSALKAILAWKDTSVLRYQEHLLNFLDDARFREEASVFLRLDEEEGIRPGDLKSLAPVLLRLLYGLLIGQSGGANGARSKQIKRKAIFVALARFPAEVLGAFVDIAIRPLEQPRTESMRSSYGILECRAHPRIQLGALNMINDMLDTLGADLQPYVSRIADVAMSCLLRSTMDAKDQNGEMESGDHASMFKAIRRLAYACLAQAFSHAPEQDWSLTIRTLVSQVLLPRMDNFTAEMAQSTSGLLKLIAAWTASPSAAQILFGHAPDLFRSLLEALVSHISPDGVKIFILDEIVANLLRHAVPDEDAIIAGDETPNGVLRAFLEARASTLLKALSSTLQSSTSKQILDSSLACTIRTASLLEGEEGLNDFMVVASNLLEDSSKKVPLPTKRLLLEAIDRIVRQAPEGGVADDVFDTAYASISSLFALFRDREGREDLCKTLLSLCRGRLDLDMSAKLCEDLESFATGRLDEPDFARRDAAFSSISNDFYLQLSAQQWRPLIYCMLFHIRNNDELTIRTNASLALQKSADAVAHRIDTDADPSSFRQLVSKILTPGIQAGMRQSSELIRMEYLKVLAYMVKRLPSFADLENLTTLLAADDDEASFFTNVLHVQQHRRLRALRRLAAAADKGQISSNNVANTFLPLLEHFVLDAASDEGAHNLTNESINTISSLARCLNWSQYKATMRRYLGLIKDMEGKEKTTLRLIGATIEALYRACKSSKDASMDVPASCSADMIALQRTLPGTEILTSSVVEHMLPPLVKFLHLKDESTVSLRVPVGVIVVKLLKCVPDEVMTTRLPAVLLDLCHILRSRDQGSRDMTRKTLSEVTNLLGPTYFNFIVKELRSALQRGYQLHVLSFTVHSILVENLEQLQPGDLDHCLPEVVSIVMDDIFGIAGQEKDAEEYVSRMKEVKSSKSFDSMEIMAKITTIPHLHEMVRPIRSLLNEKLDLRTVKKIDELLRRMGLGMVQNPCIVDRDALVFCYELAQKGLATEKAEQGRPKPFNDYKTRRYLIQMESANKSMKKGSTSSYLFKLSRFGLDLLRTLLTKHESLKTPANVAGFVPIASEALVTAPAEEVQLACLRLLTTIIGVPLPLLDKNVSTYAVEAVNIIRAAPAMTTEPAQAALKFIAAALREKAATKIREADLAYVLKRVKPDLEEPDRQGVMFNFLKAVLAKKLVVTEVYEIMDTVAGIMVTNQTGHSRDSARSLWVDFVLGYPSGEGRTSKQVDFLVRNVGYKYAEGRASVMEALHLLIKKIPGSKGQEMAKSVFVPLIMVMVNDEDKGCREMAGALIKQILDGADEDRLEGYLSLLRSWLDQTEQVLLTRVGLQVWKTVLELGRAGAKDVDFLLGRVKALLPTEARVVPQENWEVVYHALQAAVEMANRLPAVAFSQKALELWDSIYRCLHFPHTWVKLSAARMVGVLFGEIGKHHKDTGLAELPLRTAGHLSLSATQLQELCGGHLRMMRYEGSGEPLLAQVCRNLVFLGRCFGANAMTWKQTMEHGEDAEVPSDSDVADDEQRTVEGTGETAAAHLILSLAKIVRQNQSSTSPATLPPKLAALQTLHALVPRLEIEELGDRVEAVIHPLLLLTDASIPKPSSTNPTFTEQWAALTTLAHEMLSLLQDKLGSSAYVKAVGKAQGRLRENREERRAKRRIEAVAMPELAQKRKVRKAAAKGRRKQEKGEGYKGRRQGW